MNNYLKKIQLQFLDSRKAKGFSKTTIRSDKVYTNIFFDYLTDQNLSDITHLSKEHLFNFSTYLTTYKNSKLQPSTQHGILTKVRMFCKFLSDREILSYDLSCFISLPKLGIKLPKNILSTKQMTKLLHSTNINTVLGLRDRSILELLYSSGIRNSELVNLKLTDINFRDNEIYIFQGKGGKDRLVPLGRITKEFLQIYLIKSRPKLQRQNSNNYLFLTSRGTRCSCENLRYIVKKYSNKSELPKINPHTLRHTCATHLLKNNAPIRYIQKLLGHKSISSTQIYTHVSIEDLKEIHKKCHPRER